VTYDVTAMLQEGGNAVGVLLGQGWFRNRALLAQIDIDLAGGRTMSVVSDRTWTMADGPVVMDSVYNGETYDARLEAPGWDRPGFAGQGWKPAAAAPAPKGVLSAQMMPAIQVMDTIVPFKMSNPQPGVYVFDMGQNFSGWARLRVAGQRGTAVRLRFAEMLYDNGMINQENLRGARAEDVYILKGEGQEVFEPRFTYHGFRFVELTGFPGVPTAETIRGRLVHSGLAQIGSFACSKPILNALQRIVTWGQKTNLHSVPTDCDQRDERQGWMGDAQGTAEEAIMNFDMAAFYTNFLRDIRDVQDEKGQITDTVPHIWGSRPADPAWGTAYPLIAWYMYRYYGDTRILAGHYDGLKAYVDFLRSKAEKGLVRYSYYGDWVAVEKTPGSLVSAFYYYYDVRILADAARVLKKDADARMYTALGDDIRKAFNAEFFDPKTGSYANGSQTANTLPLFLDLATPAERGPAWGNLFDAIAYKNGSHLTTGIIGTKYIMEILDRQGNSDLAYDLACQTTYPSWGYMIENGATTLWELWQKREGPSMNSHNHPMFGSVGSWLYKTLAGINLDERAVGFEKFRIAPAMVRDLMFAAGSIESIRGRIVSSWKRSAKSVTMDVEIPCGSEAEIVLPAFNLVNIILREGGTIIWAAGKPVAAAAGVLSIEEKTPEKIVLIKAGSGRYLFELTGD
jgi:alpha-L-rhamnosidase